MKHLRSKRWRRVVSALGLLLSVILGWQTSVHAGHGHFREAAAGGQHVHASDHAATVAMATTLAAVDHHGIAKAGAACFVCRLGGGLHGSLSTASVVAPQLSGQRHPLPLASALVARDSEAANRPRGPPILA